MQLSPGQLAIVVVGERRDLLAHRDHALDAIEDHLLDGTTLVTTRGRVIKVAGEVI